MAGTSSAWAWVGEHFTATATDTFRLSTSTRLIAYLEAFKEVGEYASARVDIKIHCWRILWIFYLHVKTHTIWTDYISFYDDTSHTWSNEVITGRMYVDLLNNAEYCFAAELSVSKQDNGRVCKTPDGYYAELKVDWLEYYIAP
ncbi:MAG: hypothetical protein RTU30_11680 [Candidatus Thorarchaeota archaeon]